MWATVGAVCTVESEAVDVVVAVVAVVGYVRYLQRCSHSYYR